MISTIVDTTSAAPKSCLEEADTRQLTQRLAPHCSRMLRIGVSHVRIQYAVHEGIWEASGNAFDATLRPIGATLTRAIITDVVRIFFELLTVRHPNWQEGRGSFGTVTWDLATNELEHRHHNRGPVLETHIHRGM
jgi:hypothetical protein